MTPHRRLCLAVSVPLTALLCGALASVASTSPAAGLAAPPAADLQRVRLAAVPGESSARPTAGYRPVRTATMPLPAAGGRAWRLRGFRTNGFAQVGATWRGRDPVLQARSRTAGDRWGRWQSLHAIEDGPTAGAGEGRSGLRGADLWWAGESRDVQVRVRGAGYRRLKVVLIDPGDRASDARPVPTPASDEAQSRQARKRPNRAPRPRIFSRRTWGANESWRENPRYIRKILAVHVHHTVNSNSYRRSDVAGLIRGMYRYHVFSLGWSDIGYNMLVDKFGRAWAGRAGGVRRKVRGAHTLGFNENGTGIAVIGNFETAYAPRPARWKVAALAAWKLDKEGLNPARWRRIWSHGSDLYPRYSRPKLPRVAGHRDTNQTACPGINLYRKLGGIRRAAQKRVNRYG